MMLINYIFYVPIGHLYIFFWEMIPQDISSLFAGLPFHWFQEFFIYQDNGLSQIYPCIANIFSPLCRKLPSWIFKSLISQVRSLGFGSCLMLIVLFVRMASSF